MMARTQIRTALWYSIPIPWSRPILLHKLVGELAHCKKPYKNTAIYKDLCKYLSMTFARFDWNEAKKAANPGPWA